MFMLAPVDEAMEWLDAMNGLNERKSSVLAAKWAREGEWAWAVHASKASKQGAAALQKSAELAAANAAGPMAFALKGKPADWVPKWVEFWRVHGEAKMIAMVSEYLEKRAQQRPSAIRLFNESQALFRSEKRDDAFKVLEKLRNEAPYTYQGYFACKWLSEKK